MLSLQTTKRHSNYTFLHVCFCICLPACFLAQVLACLIVGVNLSLFAYLLSLFTSLTCLPVFLHTCLLFLPFLSVWLLSGVHAWLTTCPSCVCFSACLHTFFVCLAACLSAYRHRSTEQTPGYKLARCTYTGSCWEVVKQTTINKERQTNCTLKLC